MLAVAAVAAAAAVGEEGAPQRLRSARLRADRAVWSRARRGVRDENLPPPPRPTHAHRLRPGQRARAKRRLAPRARARTHTAVTSDHNRAPQIRCRSAGSQTPARTRPARAVARAGLLSRDPGSGPGRGPGGRVECLRPRPRECKTAGATDLGVGAACEQAVEDGRLYILVYLRNSLLHREGLAIYTMDKVPQ